MIFFRKKKAKAQEPKKKRHTYKLGGGWGNSIQLMSKPEIFLTLNENTRVRVVGWKSRKPRVGDLLLMEMEMSWLWLKFIKIENTYNPKDMFFGNLKPVKQEMK